MVKRAKSKLFSAQVVPSIFRWRAVVWIRVGPVSRRLSYLRPWSHSLEQPRAVMRSEADGGTLVTSTNLVASRDVASNVAVAVAAAAAAVVVVATNAILVESVGLVSADAGLAGTGQMDLASPPVESENSVGSLHGTRQIRPDADCPGVGWYTPSQADVADLLDETRQHGVPAEMYLGPVVGGPDTRDVQHGVKWLCMHVWT
jgi:hypothetical protein